MKIEEEIGQILKENNYTVATAESCTGGLVSSLLTDVSGSSEYVKLNFVTYSNDAKNKILGVSHAILDNYGAVSEECAFAMAEGLYATTGCDVAICTTGIAGPSGGSHEKPVGLVYVGVFFKGIAYVKEFRLPSNIERTKMKKLFAQKALEYAISIISENRLANY